MQLQKLADKKTNVAFIYNHDSDFAADHFYHYFRKYIFFKREQRLKKYLELNIMF